MWTVVDKQGRFKSKMSFARLIDAMKYRQILHSRYPQYDLVVVMRKENEE